MKKILFIALAMVSMAFSVNAQTADDFKLSADRAAKLQTLVDDYKICGNDNIDGYGNAVKEAAIAAIANSVQLEDLYKRQIGNTEDGVTDVTIKKPTLEEWVALSATIAEEALSIKNATDKLEAASKEAKDLAESVTKNKNPMKAAKVAKLAKAATAVVNFGSQATPVLLEESVAQAKAVKTIIETLKSGKNL